MAWVRHGDHWSSLGVFELDGDGRSLLVCEEESVAVRPDEVRVTKESKAGRAPEGPAALEWRTPD